MMENGSPLHRRGLDLCPGVNATVHILPLANNRDHLYLEPTIRPGSRLR